MIENGSSAMEMQQLNGNGKAPGNIFYGENGLDEMRVLSEGSASTQKHTNRTVVPITPKNKPDENAPDYLVKDKKEYDSAVKEVFETSMDMMPLWWDGVGFFGFDHKKLGRLQGEPVRWYTRYKSIGYTLSLLLVSAFIIYIVVNEVVKLNTIKTQTTTLVMYQDYDFKYQDAIPLRITNWFRVDETVERVEKHRQKENDY